jgi:hypothetical protein
MAGVTGGMKTLSRSTRLNTNGISRPWHAPSRPPIAGVGQAKRYMNVGACFDCCSAVRAAGTR